MAATTAILAPSKPDFSSIGTEQKSLFDWVINPQALYNRFGSSSQAWTTQNEFSTSGRGEDYLESIRLFPDVRSEGTLDLLRLAHPQGSLEFDGDYIIADLLAGDGYIEETSKRHLSSAPLFVNSDSSPFMVQQCRKKEMFAVCEFAQDLFWLKDESVDAVIFAYGTHHIDRVFRSQAAKEGARILKSGGRWVLHDFEEDGPMARFFGEVVNEYGKTRHDYPHFTRQEMLNLAQDAGLSDIAIEYIADPFVVQAPSKLAAKRLLCNYVIKMYGLSGLENELDFTFHLLEQYFSVNLTENLSGYEARLIRNALVCHGTK
ncbi:ubiquinone/menaquinone biosynthesis C-methyltransferase UbiE [Microcystis aeruginosa NIES-1211]|jgi:ubiquinone/menaquinone biosynthesis C-methylase UbiE|uniref:class I SAM-dependent methyltransferase n=1 Tax=Microcystis TaxID=1125 RepID=UPI000D7BA171|nr:class I SAM-dependent methyltransferase [Microcystis aeruginosa]GBL16065.1 ubiquinone/menaquinone biosynthesis C-methyltransferase UbiE [Microcystis aeruginosa NIES-1211]